MLSIGTIDSYPHYAMGVIIGILPHASFFTIITITWANSRQTVHRIVGALYSVVDPEPLVAESVSEVLDYLFPPAHPPLE